MYKLFFVNAREVDVSKTLLIENNHMNVFFGIAWKQRKSTYLTKCNKAQWIFYIESKILSLCKNLYICLHTYQSYSNVLSLFEYQAITIFCNFFSILLQLSKKLKIIVMVLCLVSRVSNENLQNCYINKNYVSRILQLKFT